MAEPSPAGTSASSRPSASPRRSQPSLLTVPHAELFFPLPVTTSIENVVLVKNTNDFKVLYRVRSTNKDKCYIVRPRFGKLHPGEDLKLRIILNHEVLTSKKLPLPDKNTKDRFVIESRRMLPQEEEAEKGEASPAPVEQLWKTGGNAPTTMVELPCKFSSEKPDQVVVKESTKGKAAAAAAAVSKSGASGAASAEEFVNASKAKAQVPPPRPPPYQSVDAAAAAASTVAATTKDKVAGLSRSGNESSATATPHQQDSPIDPSPKTKEKESKAAPSAFHGRNGSSTTASPTTPASNGSPLPKAAGRPTATPAANNGSSSSSPVAKKNKEKMTVGAVIHQTFFGSIPISLILPLLVLAFLLAVSW